MVEGKINIKVNGIVIFKDGTAAGQFHNVKNPKKLIQWFEDKKRAVAHVNLYYAENKDSHKKGEFYKRVKA